MQTNDKALAVEFNFHPYMIPPHQLCDRRFTAETAETAEKEALTVLGVLCELCGKTTHFFHTP